MARKQTILVVDDREQNLILFNQVLRRFGYDVVLASDGAEALAQARRHHPDLILLDLMMEGMDGYETARRLREDPATSATPVVATTGSAPEELPQPPREAGFRAMLSKPFQLSALRRMVAEVLGEAGGAGERIEALRPMP